MQCSTMFKLGVERAVRVKRSSVRVRSGLILLAFAAASGAADDGAAAFRRGDFDQAVASFARKAALADRVAQNNLGVMYLKGHGVAVDYARARALLDAWKSSTDRPKRDGSPPTSFRDRRAL